MPLKMSAPAGGLMRRMIIIKKTAKAYMISVKKFYTKLWRLD